MPDSPSSDPKTDERKVIVVAPHAEIHIEEKGKSDDKEGGDKKESDAKEGGDKKDGGKDGKEKKKFKWTPLKIILAVWWAW